MERKRTIKREIYSRGKYFKTYEDVKIYFKEKGITSEYQWRRFRNGRPEDVPSNPSSFYKRYGWTTWYDLFDKDDPQWVCYKTAQQEIAKRNLKSHNEFRAFCKKLGKKLGIPSNPNRFYKGSGWENWGSFLGHGKGVGQGCKKYSIDIDFFKHWSREMAYILGYWWADGYTNGKYTIIIELAEKDKKILENMSKVMNYNKKLNCCSKDNKKYYSLQIYRKEMVKDILKLGGKKNKSLDIGFPNVPDRYIPDFIRGYFDGDGSVFLSRSVKRFNSSFVSASGEFMSALRKVIRNKVGIKGSFHKRLYKKNKNPVYTLCFGEKDTKKLGEFMYNDSKLFLTRKKNIFKQLDMKYENRMDVANWKKKQEHSALPRIGTM